MQAWSVCSARVMQPSSFHDGLTLTSCCRCSAMASSSRLVNIVLPFKGSSRSTRSTHAVPLSKNYISLLLLEPGSTSRLQTREKMVASLYSMNSRLGSSTENQSVKPSTHLRSGIISFRRSGSWVCFGGGKRLRQPRVWKTKQRIGTVNKSEKLLRKLDGLSDSKEEVYGVLDAFIAWELEFPLVALKKALAALKIQKDWKRIIQISKWMLSKGQGKTLGTYSLLMEALDREGRVQEAEEIWQKIFEENLEFVPRALFSQVISMYQRHGMHDKLLEVFADMEELRVKPLVDTVNIVAQTYKTLGIFDKYEKVLKKYPAPAWEYQYYKGKRMKIRYDKTADGLGFPEDADNRRLSLDDGSTDLISNSNVSSTDAECHSDREMKGGSPSGMNELLEGGKNSFMQ